MRNLTAAILLLMPGAGAQTTWFVDVNASAGGNGSSAAPFTSIQTGINAAAGSDVVLVAPGRYIETIDFLGKAVSVRSSTGPLRTTIDATMTGSVVRFATLEGPASILSGFTITGGRGADGVARAGDAGGVHCEGSSPRIENCVITGNRGGNGDSGVPYIHPCCSSAFGCIPCQALGAGFAGGPGGVLCSAGSPQIVSCVIVNNIGGNGGLGGVPFTPSSGNAPGAVYAVVPANASGTITPVILHCTIANNAAGYGTIETGGILANALNPFGGFVTVHVINSIVWGNSPAQSQINFLSNVTVTYSDVPGIPAGAGNISADPLFVDPAIGDWHLDALSSCRDSATATPALPFPVAVASDFEGHPRNVNAAPDIGADEMTLTVALSQPAGAGTPVLVTVHDLIPGREYYDCFTINEPCPGGIGAGPYGGLCTADPTFLLFQLSLPVGAEPVHFLAAGGSQVFGPYPVPPAVIETVLFDFTGGTFGLVSPVRRFAVQ